MSGFISLFDWRTLVFVAIVALGVILPGLAIYNVSIIPLKKQYLPYVFLAIMVVVALIAALVGFALSGSDPGTLFTRAFIIDGIALYVLTLDRHNKQEDV